jgi:hypothetical protein
MTLGQPIYAPEELKVARDAFDQAWHVLAPHIRQHRRVDEAREKLATIVLTLQNQAIIGRRPLISRHQLRNSAIRIALAAGMVEKRPRPKRVC